MVGTIPEQYLRGNQAPPPRTLYDIFTTTAHTFPEAAALDDGEILTYAELLECVEKQAAKMRAAGLRRGARVGIRMTSGHRDLYIAILSTLAAGAAYVPVDADDPDERAELVFSEAHIDAIITDEGFHMLTHEMEGDTQPPELSDIAWIIFTSGSTGTPKGVAVTHRSAAAFVDAESVLFLVNAPGGPLGPDDRVLAGLSVAFDASCEEMWLAWSHGACLVPAPRSLVRSGMDLGPWLIRRNITVVSTVPTLAGLWPTEALDHVRLLIVGGEACSQELVDRLAACDREMWNTYGPTESTVVACAQRLFPHHPVGIGLPLVGWDLAVVDKQGEPVAYGEVGELVIGGVGLAHYLDPVNDAEKYSAELGWERAYRSGDHVRLEPEGLYFVGREDDQVKIGGRRIELGEVEASVAALDNVYTSAVTVQETASGHKVLVGYVSVDDPHLGFNHDAAHERLAETMPNALVPHICVLDELPITTSGKVDKKALPWPLPDVGVAESAELSATESWLAELWVDNLGVTVDGPDADFFSLGGTSLAAATLIAKIRERVPTIAVRDLYDYPRLGSLAEYIDNLATAEGIDLREDATARSRDVTPVSAGTRIAQTLIQIPVMTLHATRTLAWLAAFIAIAAACGVGWAEHMSPPLGLVIVMFVVFATPLGRIPLGAGIVRLITARITPGTYPRGGSVHLRIWAAERVADASGSREIAGSTWVNNYARLLGVKVGKGVDLHSLPPVTGLLTLGKHSAIEPEVDLKGYWLDGDILRVGAITIGAEARIGTRSILMPGTKIGARAHVESGSTVTGTKHVKAGARWAGSPASKVGRSKHRFPDHHPARRTYWVWIYGLTSLGLAFQPIVAIAVAAAVVMWLTLITGGATVLGTIVFAPVGGLVYFAVFTFQTWLGIRFLSLGMDTGVAPVRSAQGWRLWATERLMDQARITLFPLYAGQITPLWMRALGARVGRNVEISTAVLIPALTEIKDGAFLADDTLIGGYELGGGWMRTAKTTIGKRSFMGNSGITAPGRKLAKNSLVAVQSSTPKKAKAGSNWWGAPPERMRRVTVTDEGGDARTYEPSISMKCARGLVETLRLLAPMAHAMIFAAVVMTVLSLWARWGLAVAWLTSGLVYMLAGAVAVACAVVAKWVCVGKHRPGNHPLYSWFVWLNELQDTFIESVAMPWFFKHAIGTGEHNLALRALGAHIGRGAWVDTYWLPETDLCYIGEGATVGPGTVVQTHLFQDRVMSLDTVTIAAGATLANHSVALPASMLSDGSTVCPGSLVMRGDVVPAATTWQGNPIEPVKD